MTELVIGLDIGTSSTKAVAVDADGTVLATVTGPHGTSQPRPGQFGRTRRRSGGSSRASCCASC